MKKLEVFFDYHCPYCLKGHEQLLEFLSEEPGLEIVWHPCQIFKLPGNDSGTKHNGYCIQGMFFAADTGADLWLYHEKVYDLIFKAQVDVDNIESFVNAFKNLLDAEALKQAIVSGKYNAKVDEANHYSYQVNGIHVVPTYRADGGFLQDRQEFFNMGPSDTSYNGEENNVNFSVFRFN